MNFYPLLLSYIFTAIIGVSASHANFVAVLGSPTTGRVLANTRFANSRSSLVLHESLQTRGGSSTATSHLRDLPNQVSEEAVNKLVYEILKDRSINIRLIPDKIEGMLYKRIVCLTLNFLYEQINWYDGQPFLLGYAIKMRYYPETTGKTNTFSLAATSNVDVKVLEEAANRLLQNKNINLPLIPNILEKQIYINCLKVVFRVLDMVQSSLCAKFCGHSVGLYFNSTNSTLSHEYVLSKATNILSNASQAQLEFYEREAGVDIDNSGPFFFWTNYRRALLSQVHATMYGLILQIVQDMMDQTVIEFAGIGKIVMDLVPEGETNVTNVTTSEVESRNNGAALGRAFLYGAGFGASMIVLLVKDSIKDGELNIDFTGLSARVRGYASRIQEMIGVLVEKLGRKRGVENEG